MEGTRQRLARWALYGWAAALLAGPALHYLDHDRPHVHVHGAVVYLDGAPGLFERLFGPSSPPPTEEDPGHGRGDGAHGAAVFLAPDEPPPVLGSAVRLGPPPPPLGPRSAPSPDLPSPRARGPPSP